MWGRIWGVEAGDAADGPWLSSQTFAAVAPACAGGAAVDVVLPEPARGRFLRLRAAEGWGAGAVALAQVLQESGCACSCSMPAYGTYGKHVYLHMCDYMSCAYVSAQADGRPGHAHAYSGVLHGHVQVQGVP